MGKDLNKVFRNRSIKSLVEKSFFENQINSVARERLQKDNQVSCIGPKEPLTQNMI
jgi:hypothetical protein